MTKEEIEDSKILVWHRIRPVVQRALDVWQSDCERWRREDLVHLGRTQMRHGLKEEIEADLQHFGQRELIRLVSENLHLMALVHVRVRIRFDPRTFNAGMWFEGTEYESIAWADGRAWDPLFVSMMRNIGPI